MVSSRSDVIIGTEILTIIIFPPKSILFAIAVSPESLHILTANSVSIAMPVILSSIFKNCPPIPILLLKFESIEIIPASFPNSMKSISIPEIIDMYTANSGLYCLRIIITIREVSPTPIIFIISIFNHHYFKDQI